MAEHTNDSKEGGYRVSNFSSYEEGSIPPEVEKIESSIKDRIAQTSLRSTFYWMDHLHQERLKSSKDPLPLPERVDVSLKTKKELTIHLKGGQPIEPPETTGLGDPMIYKDSDSKDSGKKSTKDEEQQETKSKDTPEKDVHEKPESSDKKMSSGVPVSGKKGGDSLKKEKFDKFHPVRAFNRAASEVILNDIDNHSVDLVSDNAVKKIRSVEDLKIGK